MGGSCFLFSASALLPGSRERLIEEFRAQADADLEEIIERLDKVSAALEGAASPSALERADVSLKRIHQGSILALRTSVTCARPDDEDEADSDTDTDSDTGADTEADTDADSETDEDDADDDAVTPAWITFAATDPAVIADRAIAAMHDAVDAAKSAPSVATRSNRSPEPDRDHD